MLPSKGTPLGPGMGTSLVEAMPDRITIKMNPIQDSITEYEYLFAVLHGYATTFKRPSQRGGVSGELPIPTAVGHGASSQDVCERGRTYVHM